MTRNKVVLDRIASERKRKSTLRKRWGGLYKKLEELSTLCEVETAAMVYSRDEEEDQPAVWPSQELVEERLKRYEFIPDVDKTFNSIKMTTLEAYLDESVTKEIDMISKEEKKKEEKEMQWTMNQYGKGLKLTDLDITQLYVLYTYGGESLKKLKERCKNLEGRNILEEDSEGQWNSDANRGKCISTIATSNDITINPDRAERQIPPLENVVITNDYIGDYNELPINLNLVFPDIFNP